MFSKLFTTIKQNRIKLLVLFLFWIILLVLADPFGKELISKSNCSDPSTSFAQITDDIKISQPFVATSDNLSSVILYLGDFGTEDSIIHMQVVDKTDDSVIFESDITSADLETSGIDYYTYEFETQTDSDGRTYEVILQGIHGDVSNCIATSMSVPAENSEYPSASINDNLSGSQATITAGYSISSAAIWLPVILLFILSVILVATGLKANEFGFLKIALCIGIFVIVLNPFPHRLDEPTHFFRSFNLAQGDVELMYDEETGQIGEMVPEDFSHIYYDIDLNPEALSSDSGYYSQPFASTETFLEDRYGSGINAIYYLPSAIGVYLGKHFGLDAGLVIYLGRLTNYLAYVLIMFIALSRMKKYKKTFFWVASSSSALYFAGSYSLDSLLAAFAMMLIGICLKYYLSDDENERVSVFDTILLLICVVMVSALKYFVYVPLLLFFFLIPYKKFGSRQKWLAVLISAFVLLALVALYQFRLLTKFPFVDDRSGSAGMGPQLAYVISNMGLTAQRFFTHFVRNIIPRLQTSFQGVYISNPTAALTQISYMFGIAAIFVGMTEDHENNFAVSVSSNESAISGESTPALVFGKKKKCTLTWVSIGISLIIIFLIMASLYLTFTPLGAESIEGIQPRYYLPFQVLLIILASMLPFKYKGKDADSLVGFMALLGVLTMMVNILMSVYIMV